MPNVVIIAGPNGAGKSTLAPALQPAVIQYRRLPFDDVTNEDS